MEAAVTARTHAEAEADAEWQLNANLLLAQAQGIHVFFSKYDGDLTCYALLRENRQERRGVDSL